MLSFKYRKSEKQRQLAAGRMEGVGEKPNHRIIQLQESLVLYKSFNTL
jgi:hypothetical protein